MSDTETTLRAEIAALTRKLQAAEGKALTAARAQAGAEREAVKAGELAQVYRDETDQMIANAADQLKQAMGISMGVWALGQWAMAASRLRDHALRQLHRENDYVKILSDFVSGSKSGNRATLETALRDAEKACTIFKGNTEKLHLQRWEMLVLHASKRSAEKYAQIRAILESE